MWDPDRWPNWLRWLLFLPAAFVMTAVVAVINGILNAIFPYAPEVVMKAFVAILLGAAFVLSGAYVAPKARIIVASILALVPVAIAVAVVLGGFKVASTPWVEIVYALCYIGGAVYAITQVSQLHGARHDATIKGQ